ncbi:type II secretion system protein [Pseudidiomarina halophila]
MRSSIIRHVKNFAGFTLLELLITLVILSIVLGGEFLCLSTWLNRPV